VHTGSPTKQWQATRRSNGCGLTLWKEMTVKVTPQYQVSLGPKTSATSCHPPPTHWGAHALSRPPPRNLRSRLGLGGRLLFSMGRCEPFIHPPLGFAAPSLLRVLCLLFLFSSIFSLSLSLSLTHTHTHTHTHTPLWPFPIPPLQYQDRTQELASALALEPHSQPALAFLDFPYPPTLVPGSNPGSGQCSST
jgi:hypothetical protein